MQSSKQLMRTKSTQWRVASLVDIFEDKKLDGNLTPYISSLASRALAHGSSLRDIFEALEELGEDPNSWRSRLRDNE
ncbi:Hypothetical Protein FCC1311_053752 [Hondaea fermentalgiana]|uniref:Uncharacterized protein n=1 Tax=Hondaea fermentalgiana TaxID=2315210 RepID=A0A2R5GKK6_9STRA|nr:Hypothetical Protein FCC1311_053752 [Hondaea fermentalgiana]|eukprot:GBG29153.1 Hypothetical Protein FCC1311_053752 [Hondaea fermentalgiana]